MTSENKILITGCRGQLGSALCALLGARAVGVDRDDIDLTDAKATDAFLRANRIDYVVNCAAYTAVDLAEEQKHECRRANVGIVENLAALSDELGYRIIHISTDYIFDGNNSVPYSESDKPAPLSVYGATKRAGETALLALAPESMIIRTGWLYCNRGRNFLLTIRRLFETGKPFGVVADQIGTPTCAADLADFIVHHALSGIWKGGIYNYSPEGVASWYDFAVAIAELSGYDSSLVSPISTAEYGAPAPRPAFSVLSKDKIKATFGLRLPHWTLQLKHCIDTL